MGNDFSRELSYISNKEICNFTYELLLGLPSYFWIAYSYDDFSIDGCSGVHNYEFETIDDA